MADNYEGGHVLDTNLLKGFERSFYGQRGMIFQHGVNVRLGGGATVR